jgi:hypothetical protein
MLLAHTVWEATPIGETADEQRRAAAFTHVLADALEKPRPSGPDYRATERPVLTSIAEDQGGLYSKASRNPRGGSTTAALESLVAESEVVSDHTHRTGYRVVDPLLAEWLRAGRPSH